MHFEILKTGLSVYTILNTIDWIRRILLFSSHSIPIWNGIIMLYGTFCFCSTYDTMKERGSQCKVCTGTFFHHIRVCIMEACSSRMEGKTGCGIISQCSESLLYCFILGYIHIGRWNCFGFGTPSCIQERESLILGGDTICCGMTSTSLLYVHVWRNNHFGLCCAW